MSLPSPDLYLRNTTAFQHSDMQLYSESFASFFSQFSDRYSIHESSVQTTIAALSEAIEPNRLDQGFAHAPRTILALLGLAAHVSIPNAAWATAKIEVRISDWKATRAISELRPEDSNQMFRVRGIVTKVDQIRLGIIDGAVQCAKCGKKFEMAPKCPDCKSSHLFVCERHPTAIFTQVIEIMQVHETARLKCKLCGDLVDTAKLGAIVDISGVVSIETDPKFDRKLAFVMESNYIRILTETKGGIANSFLSGGDLPLIRSISTRPYIFPVLVNSISIRSSSNPLVRASLLLLLFSTIADPIHILISRKLEDSTDLARLAPHCIIFDERSTDSLCCQKRKNSFIAGALVQSNGGLLVVNDLDRFLSGQLTFLEALETSRERIDTFHVVDTTFSSIVVVPRPEQLEPTLAERFTLRLAIDQEQKQVRHSTPRPSPRIGVEKWSNQYLPLVERLSGVTELISAADLLKYVAYARQFVHPAWNSASRQRLSDVTKTIPELRKVKNLAQCRARCELRENVISTDVDEAAELLIGSSEGESHRGAGGRANSRQKMVNDFMLEFKRVARYKEDGALGVSEMKEIAEMLQTQLKFPSFEHFLELLSMNNYVLQSSANSYRASK
jgi:DNA replicative helicase MCM subunit Mcm2 (Cdc46/Mcm family)